MNKRIISILILVCILCCAFLLTACNEGNDVIEVTGVGLGETQITLEEGRLQYLFATVKPSNATNQEIDWSSDNHDVAMVEDGHVIAIGAGEATITAKSNNGKTATCKVTVLASPNGDDTIKYEIKFYANGGEFADGTTLLKTYASWGDYLQSVTVTREGYEFAGWYRKGQYYAGAWDFDSNMVTDALILYAGWNYINGYQSVMNALEDKVKKEMSDAENLEVDILSVFKDQNGYLCFVEKDKYGVSSYKTAICDFDEIDSDVVAQIADTSLTMITSYVAAITSDNNSYVADYMPVKYLEAGYSVIYGSVSDWVYDNDASHNTTTNGPWYSCKIKALVIDEDGHVYDYSSTIVSATTNHKLVTDGVFLSEDFDKTLTALGDLADGYYAEYLKTKDAIVSTVNYNQ